MTSTSLTAAAEAPARAAEAKQQRKTWTGLITLMWQAKLIFAGVAACP